MNDGRQSSHWTNLRRLHREAKLHDSESRFEPRRASTRSTPFDTVHCQSSEQAVASSDMNTAELRRERANAASVSHHADADGEGRAFAPNCIPELGAARCPVRAVLSSGGAGGSAGADSGSGVVGGTAGAAGQDNSATNRECDAGDVGCSGETPVECSDEGRWVAATAACAFGSTEGACTECVDDTRRCLEGSAQICVNEAWNTESMCTATCEAGECVEACMEGRRQCDGNLVLQICEAGVYVDYEECDFLCQGDTCTGLCSPDSTRCDPDTENNVQRCDTAGRWSAGTECADGGFCVDGACRPCRPGTRRCEESMRQECCDNGG